jgi:virginiamycin A acetyltransferase
MKRLLYNLHTQLFGDKTWMIYIKNKFSNNSVQIEHPVNIGRKTQITGNVNIGDSVTVGRKTQITGNVDIKKKVSISNNILISGDINIGEYTNLNGYNSVIGEVNIGKYCAIAPRARMRAHDHSTNKAGMQMEFYNQIGTNLPSNSNGPIEIGNDVWICSDTKILSDVKIGNGAVIAADSVVVDDVDPYSIVAGNPATRKKYRFDQSTIEALQEIAWWDWSEKKQKQNTEFFDADLREIKNVHSLVRE